MEPWVPPEQEPPPAERPLRIPGLEGPRQQSILRAPPLPGNSIRGTLRLAEGVAAPPGGVVFVIARAEAGGPPLAAKRLAGAFPLEFSLGPGDLMMQETPFTGPMRIAARVDEDGNPGTQGPGDLVAEHPESLSPGATGVELILAPSR
jgi:hypothetical protein